MVLVLAAAVLAVLLGVALVYSVRADRRPDAAGSQTDKLPVGAEAAIWSIVEAVPDPRNHLALTRDLTGEVRITGTPLDPDHRARTAARGPTEAPTAADLWDDVPAPVAQLDTATDLWDDEPAPVAQLDGDTLDLRSLERVF